MRRHNIFQEYDYVKIECIYHQRRYDGGRLAEAPHGAGEAAACDIHDIAITPRDEDSRYLLLSTVFNITPLCGYF
jgi:hypothetical protein